MPFRVEPVRHLKAACRVTIGPAVVALLAGCAALAPIDGEPIDSRYAVGGGAFRSGPVLYILARVRQQDRVTTVCGAWAQDGYSALSSFAVRDVLDGARVVSGGVTVLGGLGAFRRLPFRVNLTGATASCYVTAVPWSERIAVGPVEVVTTVYQRTSDRVTTRFDPGPVDRIVD